MKADSTLLMWGLSVGSDHPSSMIQQETVEPLWHKPVLFQQLKSILASEIDHGLGQKTYHPH